jgi:hypothetical protein
VTRNDDDDNNNNNNNNNIQDPILLLKIPTDKQKSFSENYRQFGHAPGLN